MAGLRLPWGRYGLYGLAGFVGGAIVAAALLLVDGRGASQAQLEALRTRIENVELATGDPQQVAAIRRRVHELAARIEALANLSGSEPLVRQLAEIDAAVTSLRTLIDEAEAQPGGDELLARVRRHELQANLEQISEELVRLDTRLAKLAGDVTRTKARLSGRLESLEAATPNDLPERLEQWSTDVRKLQSRVAQLERDEMTRDVRRAALALALANLTRAAETSRPFLTELKALESLDPDNRSVAALNPYAESGLPSVPALTGRFDKVADEVVKVWRREHGRGIFEWLWDSIVGLFSVRPVGDVEGTDAPALVARAEQRLQEGELEPAVQELERLSEAEQAVAQPWLEAARARLHLDSLISEVNRTVLEGIAQAEAERKAREESFVPAPAVEESPAEAAGPPPEQPKGEERPAGGTPAPSGPPAGEGASQSQGEADGASER